MYNMEVQLDFSFFVGSAKRALISNWPRISSIDYLLTASFCLNDEIDEV